MRFEFATATRILFGTGALGEAGPLAAGMGHCALVVTGHTVRRAAPLVAALKARLVACQTFSVKGEPTLETIRQGRACALESRCDLVIGFGGGSALDAAKAIAVLLTHRGDPLDYLEVIGKGQPLTQPALPLIAIPTTAGTGTEVTRNAVLGSPDHGVKASLRSSLLLPRLALVDPELSYDLPPQLTASTGLDALTQLIEPFVSNRANPMTDALCREGMRRVARSLRRAYQQGNDIEARQDMALASLWSGLTLANAGLGAVHGLASPIGGRFSVPHGSVCAALLPHVMAINIQALQTRAPTHPALERYNEIARLMSGDPTATAIDAVHWIKELCQALRVAGLASFGITPGSFAGLIEKAAAASSMRGNPIPLLPEELDEVLHRAL